MSYILEALRKSERERRQAHAPTLSDVVTVESPKSQPVRRWAVPAVLAVVLGNGVVLTYLWTRGDGEKATQPVPVTSGTTAVAQPVTELPLPAAVDTETQALADKLKELEGRVAKIDAKATASNHREGSAATVRQTLASSKLAETLKPPQPAPRKPIRADTAPENLSLPKFTAPQPTVPQPQQSNNERWPMEERASKPDPSLGTPADSLHVSKANPLPSFAELPVDIRAKIPTMKVNVMAYSAEPAERFAVIDFVRYAPGEQLPSGAKLVDIAPDGLVLEMDKRKFKYKQ